MLARTSTISNRVLLVHGCGFKPPQEALSDVSLAALRAGVARDFPEQLQRYDELTVQLAYYGDLGNAELSASKRHYDPQLDIADRSNALQELRKIDARKRFGIRQYDRQPGKSAVPEFLSNLIAPLCGSLGLMNSLLRRLAPDFARYLTDADLAEQLRARVRAALCEQLERDARVLVLAHGTGCVIVYDVLWQLSNDQQYASRYGDYKVDTLVTLGAPLGDNYIRKRLLGAGSGNVSYPQNVINWHNVAAEDDYVCHDNTLADDFKPMLAQHSVSAVQDYRIYNLAVRFGKSNPHSSVGYYIHPRTSKLIVDWLGTTAIEPDPVYTI